MDSALGRLFKLIPDPVRENTDPYLICAVWNVEHLLFLPRVLDENALLLLLEVNTSR